jgi:hypothetical protein
MNAALETVVEAAFATATGQNLGLDHHFGGAF